MSLAPILYKGFQSPTSPDPSSNTGSDSKSHSSPNEYVEARIDNLSLLWLSDGTDSIHLAIFTHLGIEFDRVNVIGRKIGIWWDRNYSSIGGSILSERDGPDGRVYCRLSISGKACGANSSIRMRGFIQWCASNLACLRCSRIDIAIDDFSRMLKVDEIIQACESGNYHGFKKSKSTKNHNSKYGGWTVNLASRQGEKFIRIYDKYAESEGKINSIRYEAEISGNLSNKLFSMLLEFPRGEREYQMELINYAVGTIGFIERIDKNIHKNPLLPWWKEWLEYLKCCPKKLHVRRIEPKINTKKRWIERAVGKSLALLKDALGAVEMKRYMDLIMKEAKQRYSSMDELILKEYRQVMNMQKSGYDVLVT